MKKYHVSSFVAILFLMFSSTLFAGTVFGPNQYTRTTGAPDTFTQNFSANAGEASLIITNGAESGKHRVTSALISINNEIIFNTDDFKQKDYISEIPLQLLDSNSISIELNSKPGTYLSIEITQQTTSTSITFTCTPESIIVGQSTTLSWSSVLTDSVSIDNGIGNVPLNGTLTVSPNETTIYTITAVGAEGTAIRQKTLTVSEPQPPVVTLGSSNTNIFTGDSVTLSWTSMYVDSCQITPEIGAVEPNGFLIVTPSESITYTITATGLGGTASSDITITVGDMPIPTTVTLTANPESIIIGEVSELVWESTNATNVTIDQGIGPVAFNGSISISPAETTTYTITAVGPETTATYSVTITVSEPTPLTVSISVTPAIIYHGETAALSWNSENANICEISPDIGVVALNGTTTITPEQTTIYTITVTGPGGSVTDTEQVIVAADVEPQPEGSFGLRYEDLIPANTTLQSYCAERFALINGTVLDLSSAPLPGVNIGILHHPEYGTTTTDDNGFFSLPVEGGSTMTVAYTIAGLITSHRQIDVLWNNIAVIDPVVMISTDPESTTIIFDGNPATVMSHRSSAVSDEFGTRTCTLVFSGDNRAYEVDENGNTVREITSATVRATEFATIESMPSVLPPTSAYTYCAELTFGEAERVRFDQPVVMWVDNFLGFATGSIVPVGYYDRDKGVWIPSDNGIVVKLLDTNGDGIVDAIDVDGDNLADDLDGDGLTVDEVAGLGDPAIYVPGASFWRSETTHFTPYDYNWPYGPPPGAKFPNADGRTDIDEQEKDPCKTPTNSFVADRSRVFHEDIPIAGTGMTLHYASNRVNGYLSLVKVPASGDTVPEDLKSIEVYLNVAGRRFHQTLAPLPDQTATFTWDGRDFRGNPISGSTRGWVEIEFVYPANYFDPGEYVQSFGQVGPYATGISARQEFVYRSYENIEVERDHPEVIAEGWTVSPHHHFYSIDLRKIYKGDGNTGFYSPNTLDLFAGIVTPGYSGDNGPATQAQFDKPTNIAADAEGNIYIADLGNNRIRKVDRDGIVTTVAGNGVAGYGGDNGLALDAQINGACGIAVDGEGILYIADTNNHRIRKVDHDGIITTVAGNGVAGFTGDDGTAVNAQIQFPRGVTLDNSGNILIADTDNHRIRKVDTNGIITTVVGNGLAGFGGDDCPAKDTSLNSPQGIAVDKKGNFLIADTNNHRIRKVSISGTITTVAGNGVAGFSGEGVEATTAQLNNPAAVAIDKEGSLYIADTSNHRIRKVNVKGFINTLAGCGFIGVQTGSSPTESDLAFPQGIAIGPENRSYFPISYPDYFAAILVTGASAIGTLIDGSGQAYNDPSGEAYIIHDGNLHTSTTNLEDHTPINYFSYDDEDRLIAVFDRAMNMTYIERNLYGLPQVFISPDGIRTELVFNLLNQLVGISNPDGGYYSFEYTPGSLMTAETDPLGNRFEHTFDQNGRITDVTDPEEGHWHYEVTNNADGTILTQLTTAENQTTTYFDRTLKSGEFTSFIAGPSGDVTEFHEPEDGMTADKTLPCGMNMLFEYALDPGYRFNYIKNQTLTQPSGLEKIITEERLYTDLDNDHAHDQFTKTITINDNASIYFVDKTQNQKTLTTPEGRITTTVYDAETGLTLETGVAGLLPTTCGRDTRGRLINLTRGLRASSYTYDSYGYLASSTDPENRITTFDYDSMGRLTAAHRPDSSAIEYTYDKNGNLTVLTNPLTISHDFAYNGVDSKTSYRTPMNNSYQYIYDRDRRLVKTIFPSTREINNIYDSENPGRLLQMQTPEGNIDYSYHPDGTRVASVTNGIESIAYNYDGGLLTGETFSGTLNTDISLTHNNNFDPETLTYAGATETFTYDNDNLLTGFGQFTITRNAQNGLPEEVSSPASTLSRIFNGHGEIEIQTTVVGGQNLSLWSLTRDHNGRITEKTETVNGVTSDLDYTYDEMGRLLTVTENGTLSEEYQYNLNGSRTYEMNTQRGIVGRSLSYSDEDHLLAAGNTIYNYDFDGFLQTKTDGSEVTNYNYSSRGELLDVTLPNGTIIGYIHDPLGRRIAKKVNDAITEKYLWQGLTRMLAVYDGSDNLIMRFEYADSRMPQAMTKEGIIYYLTYDQIGSLRIVADASCNVVKEINYDSFGSIIADSNPTFTTPFGFAGGFHDRDTKLVRFGHRDYDPETGRWTAKDPIFFDGGDTDLYGYCLNDPVNGVDPEGKIFVQLGVAVTMLSATFWALHKWSDSPEFQDTLEKKDKLNRDNISDEEYIKALDDYHESFNAACGKGEQVIDLLNETKPWTVVGPNRSR